jgi:hypothetical protein
MRASPLCRSEHYDLTLFGKFANISPLCTIHNHIALIPRHDNSELQIEVTLYELPSRIDVPIYNANDFCTSFDASRVL